jgi:hypothetical protein
MVVLGAVGYRQGQRKDRAIEGLLLGALAGLIGLVILHYLKPKQPAAAQTWGTAASFGAAAPATYAQQTSYGYGQTTVLPGALAAGPIVEANPYAPISETVGYGYEQPVPVAQPEPAAPAAQWFADPSGRHQHRWWDGSTWTEHVADNGVASVDAPLAQPS